MRCPYCGFEEDRVLDSRSNKDGSEIRRRRECNKCHRRFTTRETIEMSFPLVVKKDGKREPFNPDKVRNGIKKACEKRPISADQINDMVKKVEQATIEFGENEVPSKFIGELITKELKKVDHVAYVRFASVYKDFQDATQFMKELEKLLKNQKK